ncbi:MAG: hypothetical protein AABW47_04175 [Nanoarchaeota archaeon]
MSLENKKISALFILEVIGRPPEYLTESLNELIKKIGAEKGVKVTDSKVNESVLMKDQKDFYTNFAEIEIEADNMLNIAILMFKYMPAHIEILSPQNISMTNSDWGDILDELTRRLHGYEEITRITQGEKLILEKKLKALTESTEDKKKK